MAVSLYTSRVILHALGVVDYGINNAVGGFVVLFNLISNSLSGSVSRFLTFELGKGDLDKLKKIFATSISIQIALAALVLLIAETIGLWFLNTHMTFPDDRVVAANWIYQASIISFALCLICVPYNAAIVAHEHMGTFAYVGVVQTISRLAIVLFVAYAPWGFDKLIVYALSIISENLLWRFFYTYYCRRHFEECRIHFLKFEKGYFKEMGAFAGWSFIGSTSSLLRDHGVNILFNVFVGPVLNAARGISTTINNTLSNFVANFMTAIRPQIVKSYAAKDFARTFQLVFMGSRFSSYILLLLILPIIIETDFILSLWLGQYPLHTVHFVRLLLIMTTIDSISNTLIMLLMAIGNIRNYQICVGGLVLLNFPLSYLCLSHNMIPESTLIVGICIGICSLFLRLYFLHSQVQFPVINFLKIVCLRVLLVAIVATVPTLIIHWLLDSNEWIRFLATCSTSICSCIIAVWTLGCTADERQYIRGKIAIAKTKAIGTLLSIRK